MELSTQMWQVLTLGCLLVAAIFVIAHVLLHREYRLLLIQNEELKRLANTDQLTGLNNRRLFETRAPYLMKLLPPSEDGRVKYQTRQAHIPAWTVALIDVDHFKNINDTHGHPVGDVVLVQLAKQLSGLLRDSDLICRLGGEEFIVLLPDGTADARRVAEKLRVSVANMDLGLEGVAGVTISIGLCTVAHQVPLTQLLERADVALYKAKENGRNRIESVPFEE